MSNPLPFLPGQVFQHGHYVRVEVEQKKDGIYPIVTTGRASQVMPWRYDRERKVEVCLLRQQRPDTDDRPILKACGGYDNVPFEVVSSLERRNEMAETNLRKKLGLEPGPSGIVWWRECLGCGPQYNFPIPYGFGYDPIEVGDPTVPGCARQWMTLEEAVRLATDQNSPFFDDFTTAQLLILLARHAELVK